MGRVARRLARAGGALANPSIRRVQVAWTGCITAEMAQAVGLAVVAYRLTGLYGVATLGLVRSLPAALIGPFAAGFVDRRRRERVLLEVLAARAALMAGAAIVVASALPVALVFVVAAVDAVVYSVWWPTQSALLPELATSANEATSANVATTVVENGGSLVGPLVGAALLRLASPAAVFVAAAIVLAVSAIVVVPLARRALPRERPADGHASHGAFAGFRVAFGERHPRTIISLYLLQTFALGMLGVLTVATAIELLHLGESGVGVLSSAVGAGGLVGATASVALVGRRHLGTALGVALLGWGAAAILAGALPFAPVVIALLACIGVGNALVDVSALTLLQRTVDQVVLVRVLAVFEGLWWAMIGIGALAAAALIDAAGIRGALALTGAVLALAAIVEARELRRIDGVAGPPARVLERLQRVPFLESLPAAALERLAFAAASVEIPARTTVIKEGDRGELFYVVDEGEFEVHTTNGRQVPVTDGYFGEIALLRDVARTATVIARTNARVFTLTRDVFLGAVSRADASP
jgi:MFS family permease